MLTIPQVTNLLKKLHGTRQHCIELGREYGLNPFQVDVLRSMIGTTDPRAERIPEELKEKCIKIFIENPDRNCTDLANEIGIPYQKFYWIIKKAGLTSNRHRDNWSVFKVRQVIDCRDRKHYSWKQIAALVGNSKTSTQMMYYSVMCPDRYPNNHKWRIALGMEKAPEKGK